MPFFFLWQQHQINQGEGKGQRCEPVSVFLGLEIQCNSEPLFVYTIAGGTRGRESTDWKSGFQPSPVGTFGV